MGGSPGRGPGAGSQALPEHFRPASTTLCLQGLLLLSLVLYPYPHVLGQGQPFVISNLGHCLSPYSTSEVFYLLGPRCCPGTNSSVTLSKSLRSLCLSCFSVLGSPERLDLGVSPHLSR